jgi:hypothetical protein
MPLGRLRLYFGHIIELHYSNIWQRVDVLWQQSHLNLLRMVLCIHLFAISDEFILHRELASGGKSNSTLYNDKFDAINVIILSVPVPIVAIVYDFLTILLRSVKCIPTYTIETWPSKIHVWQHERNMTIVWLHETLMATLLHCMAIINSKQRPQ